MVKESQGRELIQVYFNLALLWKSSQPVLGQPEGFPLPASSTVDIKGSSLAGSRFGSFM